MLLSQKKLMHVDFLFKKQENKSSKCECSCLLSSKVLERNSNSMYTIFKRCFKI